MFVRCIAWILSIDVVSRLLDRYRVGDMWGRDGEGCGYISRQIWI